MTSSFCTAVVAPCWAFDDWRFYCDRSCTFSVGVSSELLRWTGRPKADGLTLPRVITKELPGIALGTNALRAYEGKSSELIPPGPRSRVGTWCCSSSCAGWQDLVLVERDSIQCSISLHLNTIYFYVCTHVPLGSTVACTATICLDYILGNYGHARSQGGRQPAAPNPPLYQV